MIDKYYDKIIIKCTIHAALTWHVSQYINDFHRKNTVYIQIINKQLTEPKTILTI